MAEERIEGVVTDSNQEPLPGVVLILQKDGDEHKKEEVSRADGSFVFTRLTPGGYILQAQMSGFTTEERKIQLGLNEVLRIDVVLQVSQTREN